MDNLEFLTSISQGFNPYTGEKFADDDLLISLNVQTRILNLIEELKKDSNYEKLSVRNPIRLIAPKTTIQPFAKSISNAIYNALTFGVIQNKIISFLLDNNFLYFEYENELDNKMTKFASEKGNKIGIFNGININPYGYKTHTIFYDIKAQEYIIDMLPKIFKETRQ